MFCPEYGTICTRDDYLWYRRGSIEVCGSVIMCDIHAVKERGNYQDYADIVFGTGQILGGSVYRLWIEIMS